MKRTFLMLLFTSTIILGACNNDNNEEGSNEQVKTEKTSAETSADFLADYIKADESLVDLALETEDIDRRSIDYSLREPVKPLAELENPKDLSQYAEIYYKGDISSYEANILLTISRYHPFIERDNIFALDLDRKILTVIPQDEQVVEYIRNGDVELASSTPYVNDYVLFTNELILYLDDEYTVDIYFEDINEVYMTVAWGGTGAIPMYTKTRGVLYGELDMDGNATYGEFREFLENERNYISNITEKFNDKGIDVDVKLDRSPNDELTRKENDTSFYNYTTFNVNILNLEWPGLLDHSMTTRSVYKASMAEYNDVLELSNILAKEIQEQFGNGFAMEINFEKHNLDNPAVISANHGEIVTDQVAESNTDESELTFWDEDYQYEDTSDEENDIVNSSAETVDPEEHITDYLNLLADFYNDKSDDVFDYVEEGSPAYSKLQENKKTGYFSNHVTHSVNLLEQESQTDDTFVLNVTRIYEHANSGGKNAANVDYILDTDTYKIIDYEELTNYTVDD